MNVQRVAVLLAMLSFSIAPFACGKGDDPKAEGDKPGEGNGGGSTSGGSGNRGGVTGGGATSKGGNGNTGATSNSSGGGGPTGSGGNGPSSAKVNVLTQHNDIGRSG